MHIVGYMYVFQSQMTGREKLEWCGYQTVKKF